MTKPSKVKSLDTNIILLDANNLDLLGKDSTILLTETVLDELDKKKIGLGEIAYQAREFGRKMTEAEVLDTKQLDGITITHMKYGNVYVDIVSLAKYKNGDTNDKKIIEATIKYGKVMYKSKDLTLITNDVLCKIISVSYGLVARALQTAEDVSYEFTKTIKVPSGLFRDMHRKSIHEIDKDYRIGNYNYIIEDMNTGQTKLGTVQNEVLHILGKETEMELRKQEIGPIGTGQLFLSKAIMDPTTDLVVVEALSGSGKTLVSLSNAIRLVRTNSPYSGIIYIRTSVQDVESNEEIGFLKGDLDEKTKMYFHPFMDSLDVIAKKRLGNTKLKGEELDKKLEEVTEKIIKDCGITVMTSLGLRGRTIEDSVVLIDEAQNISKAQMRKILTRIGKNCKVVIQGSNRQIDNPYVTKFTNGLSVLLEDSKNDSSIRKHMVTLNKVVRSDFAEYAENLFEGK